MPELRRCRYCGAYTGPRGGCPVNRKDCGRPESWMDRINKAMDAIGRP